MLNIPNISKLLFLNDLNILNTLPDRNYLGIYWPLLKLVMEAQLPDDVTEGNGGKQTSFAESTKKLPKISQTGLTKTL